MSAADSTGQCELLCAGEPMRKCRGRCGKNKPLEDFPRSSHCRLGREHACKECKAIQNKEWYSKNAERIREYRSKNAERIREYRSKNAERDAARGKEWAKKNPERRRASERASKLRRYGLTPDQYRSMLQKQGYVCAICCKAETQTLKGKLTALGVDHCHATGKVRGILCRRCNSGLGCVCDKPAILRRAAAYLDRHAECVIQTDRITSSVFSTIKEDGQHF